MSKAVLTCVYDAYCGWCYGFGPAYEQVLADGTFVMDSLDVAAAAGFAALRDASAEHRAAFTSAVNGVTRRLGGPVTKPEQLVRQLDPALVAAA